MSIQQLGFGSLRLERDEEKNITTNTCQEMLDQFVSKGGTYIEIAYAYWQTEEVIPKLLKKYKRESYLLTDKMPVNDNFIKKEEDYYSIFQEQLKKCDVQYFDYYLLHNLGYHTFLRSEKLGAFSFLKNIKESGLAKHVGFSFHDSASVLEEILQKYSEIIDVVQLQINYLDWESPVIQSRDCYEIALKYGKSIFVMEPIKGGRLINLPLEAVELIKEECPGETPASLALRFTASLDNVQFVLSGMSTVQQVIENQQVFSNFKPLTEHEKNVLKKIACIIHSHESIECTQCRYCEKVCPLRIPIPDLFHLYENDNNDHVGRMYIRITEENKRGKASECIRCGRCEKECSQKLPIREYLLKIREVYEPETITKKNNSRIKHIIREILGEKNIMKIKKVLKNFLCEQK